MATAREEESGKPYETGGGGGYGKFRKKPFRSSYQTTPYDRPLTAIRNPSLINNNNNNNGWLSKLVDPAQRLIASSAHRLFASVFRKRLGPPPPPPPPQPPQHQPEPEANQEARDNQQETVFSDLNAMREGATNGHDNPSTRSDQGGLTELEQILKQKTFTRFEIDRLTNLLHSKSVDLPVGNEDKRSQVILSKPVIFCDRKEEFPKTPVKENGVESHFTSMPAANSSVLDEDIASPAELAKAYMGSRPSKVSPSMLGLRSQALREETIVLSNRPFPSKSPIMSLVPRSSGHVGFPENGFVTSRSRGRSAIYSMARTPYSRVQSTATIKAVGPTIDAPGGLSSSQSAWEQNRMSGSKQGALKRRSSVLENDIGSVGPIRRIRQKSNLLSPKILSLPAPGSHLSIHGIGIGSEQPSSSMQKPVFLGEPKHSFTKVSIENGDNSFPGTSFTPVPSKSSEVASKILQQLDMLVSPREKSPTKLSPSMLRGPALKSLENIDSSNLLENAQGNNKLDGSLVTSLPGARDSTLQKQNKVEENGPSKFLLPYGRSASVMNGVESAGLVKDNVSGVRTMDSAVMNSVPHPHPHPHPQKKRGFQMSAHEDYLELDDDDYSNGVASTPLAEGREKLDTLVVESKTITTEAITMEKPPALSEFKFSSNSVSNQNTDQGSSDGSSIIVKNSGFTFTTATSPSMTVQPSGVATLSPLTSDKVASPNEFNAVPPKFRIGEKDSLSKEPNSVAPTISFVSKNVDVVPPFTFASSSSVVSDSFGPKFAVSSDPKPDSSNSFASIAAGATDSVLKVPESEKADNKNSLKAGVFFKAPETAVSSGVSMSSSTASIFSFGTPANSSSLNNGSLASIPSPFSSPIPPLVSNNVMGNSSSNISTHSVATNSSSATAITATTANTNSSSSSLSTSAAVPSLTAGSIFKFGSSVVPSTSTSQISATSGVESTEAKTKDTSFGNVTSSPFGGTSSAFTSTGSNIFGTASSAHASTGSSIFGGTSSAISSTGSSIFGGTSSANTHTGSNIFGGTSSASTGSSIFGFSAAASSSAISQSQGSAPFGVGSAQASAAGTGVASSTQSMPIQFGSSASSLSFGLAGNTAISSGNSPFGSSSSTAKLFSSGTAFGSSSAISSSEANSVSSSSSTNSTLFSSSWQAPISPAFGSTFNSTSPSTGFPFGASSSSIVSTNSAPTVFGSSTGASSGSIFPFTSSTAATSSQPVFASPNPFAFSSAPSGNNDQMNMEDSMAEDTVQATTPTVSVFGQHPITTPSSFVFGSAAQSGANPFQFGGQQNVATPQNPSPFQASGSLDFNAGGSFSLGTGGGDKSNRKIVKVKHKLRKK